MNLKSYRILCKKWAIVRGMYYQHDKDSWRFSRDSAIHWFSVYWHNGQNSSLYKITCQIGYNPSILSKNAKDDLNDDYLAWELFKFLNRRANHYAKNGNNWRIG